MESVPPNLRLQLRGAAVVAVLLLPLHALRLVQPRQLGGDLGGGGGTGGTVVQTYRAESSTWVAPARTA
jgi:hypothetical protein